MLKISAQSLNVFNEQVERQFIQKIQRLMAEKYPHIFSRFPDQIQFKIVSNMMDRAKQWGINWKSSLVIFAELMIKIAPNFDQQVQIKSALENNQDRINQTIQSINQFVPDLAWDEAEANAEDISLFLSADTLSASKIEQTASAIPLALWDIAPKINALHYATHACHYAQTLGLDEQHDAPLGLVAWRCLYGKEFNHRDKNAWVAKIMDRQRSSRERIALLKFRIAEDHGRLV